MIRTVSIGVVLGWSAKSKIGRELTKKQPSASHDRIDGIESDAAEKGSFVMDSSMET